MQPTPVSLPGEVHGQRSLAACSPWGCKELAMIKRLSLSLFYYPNSIFISLELLMGFAAGSDGKESACNAGDLGSIPGLGRSPGGGHGNRFQYSWASLVAQTVKNLPAMQETPDRFLGWVDLLEKG